MMLDPWQEIYDEHMAYAVIMCAIIIGLILKGVYQDIKGRSHK